ncbi:MAG: cell division protein FtsA [Candidatus Nealsonbacteria bacterium RIFOXYC1_FULL_40_7]|uniref:Cell division protein FtsA n=1 Tax=Candidatus Nealsonbacteria bacterium RIFOXYC1_FULL_40_7 TaxID=1801678 RepID=A0A1G2EQR4_9BACT|nr:MAG: cell division protein FtsA [Candidatus Nealsonbacteria bacterium RIFOXYC1_FULL_40_7]
MAKPYIITGLDIGSGNIKMLSVLKKAGENDFEIAGFAQAPALGVRKGVVIDSIKVSEIISSLAKEIEENSGYSPQRVYAGIGGSHIFCSSSRGLVSVSRADQRISQEDVDRVLRAAQAVSLPSNKEIIEIFPKEFIVDGGSAVKEALGMQGVRLEAETLMLCGFSPYLKNSTQTVLGAGLEVSDLILSSLASSKAILTDREKELGVCVLDIGAGTTDLAVFEEGSLLHTAVFPIGSGHITSDIAICLKTDIDIAEKIKIEFGNLRASKNKQKKNKIEYLENSQKHALDFSSRELEFIIGARVSEIFDLANKELKKISKQGMLPAGIVLTGGGSKMPGIKDSAKRELKLPCRVGSPKISYNSSEDPSLSAVTGLVLEGMELEEDFNIAPMSKRGFAERLKRLFRIFIP